ncbi:thermonuclease family protein [Aureimonas fodinaquatilis]|uniref:Thermonuclease family protein n=1 Tax=Aureimonas fodinaquatilis TaxID=2565783 RepID=A0A5B0DVV0_9HYPH|nr:thermonuclease family protein [Aureimonas fodinaquatilis]KAA0970874.1 thermonuclease family protein [Aureimonas fodinaquatilis]
MIPFYALAAVLYLSAPAQALEINGRAEVIDGDTISVAGTSERIRLYGIDAPEGQQTCETSSGKIYLCGNSSAQFLTDLIGRNGRVSCVEHTRDRYGRIVAECRTSGGKNLNNEMVRAGWAVHYERYSDGRYGRAQNDGRENKRGMWSGNFLLPEEWRRGERLQSEPTAGNGLGDCQIKGNISKSGKIYHLPGSRAYAGVKIDLERGEKWFCTEREALDAGWRAVRG